MKKLDLSIVTACDVNYLWGVFLLTASIQKMGLPVNLIVFQVAFDEAAKQYISQFPVAELREDSSNSPFAMNNRKPGYLLKADSTEYVAWFDADCFVVDSISEFLLPVNQQFQIRLRSPEENASVFERYYRPGDRIGDVPSWVLDRWKEDVGGRQTPRVTSTCPSNCFIFHSRYMRFVEEWENLISRVVNPHVNSAVDRGNPAYWMTDESALNAVMFFSENCPEPSQFRLDDLSAGHVVHFIGSPKPWIGWNKRFLYCIPKVIELLDWVERQGMKVPPIPSAFKKWRMPYSYAEAHVRGIYKDFRSQVGRSVRSIGRKFGKN